MPVLVSAFQLIFKELFLAEWKLLFYEDFVV